MKRKLNINDYAFVIKEEDIINCCVTYNFDKIKVTKFINEHKVESNEDSIRVELDGETKSGKTGHISMDLNTSLSYLNSLSNKPTEISKYISEIDAFIERDKRKYIDFNFLNNRFSDIFKNHSSIWVSKVERNIFYFKISSPDGLFSSFKVNFNN